MILDSHLHLWDPRGGGYGWLASAPAELRRPIGAAEATAELAAAGVPQAILVQADDTVADTEFLLRTAAEHDEFAGVVGWIRLDDPGATAAQLERYADRLAGVRHLVHIDPRDDFLELAPVRAGLARVASAGLVFDVPDAFPRHLRSATAVAYAVPDLVVVIDHLAKPPLGRTEFAAWAGQLRAAAAAPNCAAKLSGLRAPGASYDEATLWPAVEIALEAFGADRLMFGSDWPMSLPFGGYGPTIDVLAALIGRLSEDEQRAVWGANARRIYLGREG